MQGLLDSYSNSALWHNEAGAYAVERVAGKDLLEVLANWDTCLVTKNKSYRQFFNSPFNVSSVEHYIWLKLNSCLQ